VGARADEDDGLWAYHRRWTRCRSGHNSGNRRVGEHKLGRSAEGRVPRKTMPLLLKVKVPGKRGETVGSQDVTTGFLAETDQAKLENGAKTRRGSGGGARIRWQSLGFLRG